MNKYLVVAAGVFFASVVGCSADKGAIECGFEQTEETKGLPDKWQLNIVSGDYETAATAEAVSGSCAIAVAGANGEAELHSAPCSMSGNVAECEFWIQGEEFEKGVVSAGVEFMSAEGTVVRRSMIPVHAKEHQWSKVHFCAGMDQDYKGCTAQLVVRLEGACLVRIDEVKLSNQKSAPEINIADGGFETAPNFDKWQLRHDDGKAGIELGRTEAFDGESYLKLTGNSDWGVCLSDLQIPLSPGRRLLFQGVVRAASGDGHLKFEYWKNGQFVDHFFSDIVKQDDWTFVSLDSSNIEQPEADMIRISLGAGSETKRFSADFDQLSLFVID